jgi:hypothetical protein
MSEKKITKRIKFEFTNEEIIEECKKYSSLMELKKNSPRFYRAYYRRGLQDSGQFKDERTKKIYTHEQIIEEAKKYSHIKQFYTQGTSIYRASQRFGRDFFNEITKHMDRVSYGSEKKYTDEFIIKQGSKCDTPTDFKNNFPNLYERALTRKLINRITYKKGYIYDSYSEESIIKEASEYNSPINLIRDNQKLYAAAQTRGLLGKIKYKVGYLGSKYSRLVYVYEFSDNYFYCGLTFNEDERHSQHFFGRTKTPVREHMEKTGLVPVKKIISDGYIHSDIARVLEEETRMNYIKNGWTSLNKIRCGGLGSTQKIWTIEKVYEKAKNLKTRNDLKSVGIFNAARDLGIYHDIVKHIPNSYSKYIILDTYTGIYYHSIKEAYDFSSYKLSVGNFGIHIKKNKTRYQIV